MDGQSGDEWMEREREEWDRWIVGRLEDGWEGKRKAEGRKERGWMGGEVGGWVGLWMNRWAV